MHTLILHQITISFGFQFFFLHNSFLFFLIIFRAVSSSDATDAPEGSSLFISVAPTADPTEIDGEDPSNASIAFEIIFSLIFIRRDIRETDSAGQYSW